MEASTPAGSGSASASASAQQVGVQPAAADEEGKASTAWETHHEVQLDLAGYDKQHQQHEEEADVENPEEASLLGGHHTRELMGLSVFGVFKLVSFSGLFCGLCFVFVCVSCVLCFVF